VTAACELVARWSCRREVATVAYMSECPSKMMLL